MTSFTNVSTTTVPAVNLPFKYVNGLELSWTSNTTLTVALGQCRDSTNTYDLTLATDTVVDIGVNGVNGLDTGSVAASTMYYVFIIGDATLYHSTGLLLSTSATAPYLPSGYGIFRRIGQVVTDSSSHFLLFYQSGAGSTRQYFWDDPQIVLSGGSATSFTAVSLAKTAPPVNKLPVKLLALYTPAVATNTAAIRASGSTTSTGTVFKGSVAAVVQDLQLDAVALLVSGAAKVDYKVTASDALSLYVIGYTDSL